MDEQTYSVEIDALYKRMDKRMNKPDENRYVIYDGVMKPDDYFSGEIRLAWMLKEPYDGEDGTGGGWNYFDMFPEGKNLYELTFNKGHKSTWHPMIYISHSIHNNFPLWEEMKYIREDHSMCDVVRQVAFINAQKLPSKNYTTSHQNDLWESVNQYADILKDQITLLNPNVLIFANTIDLYKDILQLDLNKLERSGSCQYIQKEGKLFISAYHPSQRTIPRNQYVNDIIKLVEMWSKK
jgi:hypothetical protein